MKRLEEEIKQKNFKNDYHKLIVNIFFTNNWLHEKQDQIFERFDITAQQYNLLRILRGQYPNPSTINLLIERMLNKMCDASRLVEKLRLKKLVERVQCQEDKRACNVLITDSGLHLLEDIEPLMEEIFSKIATTVSKEEAQQVNYLLDKIRNI